jgi:hypothetical protein
MVDAFVAVPQKEVRWVLNDVLSQLQARVLSVHDDRELRGCRPVRDEPVTEG